MLSNITSAGLFRLRGASMEPSLCDGDLLLVIKRHGVPRRGRIVTIRMPDGAGPSWQVKRVVGLPGDNLRFEDGLLFINGTPHREHYLQGLPAYLGLDRTSFDIGDDSYFVLGDNRAHSVDSRSFGTIDGAQIAGVVAARLWPPFRLS